MVMTVLNGMVLVMSNGMPLVIFVRCDGDVMGASKKKTSILKMKRKEETREHAKKKKNVYEKCNAFLCHEPLLNEDTCMLGWVLCNRCDASYRWNCVGILKRPSGNFFCGCDKTLSSDRYNHFLPPYLSFPTIVIHLVNNFAIIALARGHRCHMSSVICVWLKNHDSQTK